MCELPIVGTIVNDAMEKHKEDDPKVGPSFFSNELLDLYSYRNLGNFL